MKSFIPEGYSSALDLYDTQSAIALIKSTFQGTLESILCLKRISAPLFVDPNTGMNDNLSGTERAVRFDVPFTGKDAEVVHSLAKWKRYALYRYHFYEGRGLYTDMNAIRRDEDLDNLHSVYVDQWDWERVINASNRTEDFLKGIVKLIVNALADTKEKVNLVYPQLTNTMERDVFFITSQELLDMYPDMTDKERENAIVKEKKTVFIMKIGGPLSNGKPHDGRAPDYDDWELNGDILVWNSVLGEALELSSMGIRVDAKSLKAQLHAANAEDRLQYAYHQGIIDGTLPLTIGGGIGQSRMCMFMLEKAHIGEVQVSVWPDEVLDACDAAGIKLL